MAGTGFSVHPSCKDLADLFASRELLFCPSAGTTDASRSHFQAQDLFEIGSGAAKGESGFMARLATMLGAERPSNGVISFTREIPLAFQGADNPPEVAPLSGSGLKLPAGKVLDAIRKGHAGLKTGEAIDQAISTQGEIDAALDREGAARGAISANGFPKIAAVGDPPFHVWNIRSIFGHRLSRKGERKSWDRSSRKIMDVSWPFLLLAAINI